MKIFNVCYTYNNSIGTAQIAALQSKDCLQVLIDNEGYNSNELSIVSVQEIGCNNSTFVALLSNNISLGNTSNKPINSLDKETIEALKLKINEYTGTLYVDNIGNKFREKAKDGHSVLCKYSDSRYCYDKGKPGIVCHLYVKRNGKYVDLGIPTKYKFIESPSLKVRIYKQYYYDYNSKEIHDNYVIQEIESFKTKRLGIFYRVSSKGRLSRRYKTWRYIARYKGSLDEKSIIEYLKKYYSSEYFKKEGEVSKVTSYSEVKGDYSIFGYKYAIGEIKNKIVPLYIENSKGGYRTFSYKYLMKGKPIKEIFVKDYNI